METHRLRRSFTSSCFSASSQRKAVRNCVAIPASAAGPPLSPAHAAAAATPPLKSPDTLPAQQFTIPKTGLWHVRSEEHTSELQSLMRISYAVFCLKKTKKQNTLSQYTDKTNDTRQLTNIQPK